MISYHPKSSPKNISQYYDFGFLVAPWFIPNMIARTMSERAWSPIVWHEGRRKTDNFKESHWFALDFDDPGTPLEQAKNLFCDMIHVIGTTKSHQIEKHGVICDRYRVLLKWEKPITNWRTYQFNAERLISHHEADSACSDPARHYFPCIDIVSVCEEGYSLEWFPHPPDYKPEISGQEYLDFLAHKQSRFENSGKFPKHVQEFLELGKTFGEGRNQSCYVTACHMMECGVEPKDIILALQKSPFSRHPPWREAEITTAVNSAVKSVLRRLKKGSEPRGRGK